MKEVLIKEYNNLKNLKLRSIEGDYTFKVNFINGCTLEILGEKPGKFKVQFINQDNNSTVYESEISNNMWCKSNRKYYLNLENNEIIFKHIFNAKGKKVYIHLDSNAIGDTLAWFPYIEEFRKNHKCQVICSTFHNSWFNLSYPEIEFIKPGTEVMDLYAMYTVGWHYNEDNTINTDCNPQDFKKYSLQECSADILGIDYNEIKPN